MPNLPTSICLPSRLSKLIRSHFTGGILIAMVISCHAAPSASTATVNISPDVTLAKTSKNRLLGGNIALWYETKQLQQVEHSPYFKQWKPGILRFPGGSWSDEIYWNGNGVRNGDKFDLTKRGPDGWKIDYSNWKPGFSVLKDGSLAPFHGHTDLPTLHKFAKANGHDAMVTVNAGMGNAKMAAEWVRWANKKMGYNVKYWEVGNELEGSWELGHIRPDGSKMDAKKYAAIFLGFAKAMKTVDPTIKIGGPTNSNDSIVFVEELIKQAGDQLDFISFHTYPVDGKTFEPGAVLAETSRVETTVKKIRGWIKQYHPAKVGKIEIGITEWHVKVHEDNLTCNMLSGLWATRFIGEMFKSNVDFANQWDQFSTTDHGGGHGLFQNDASMTPRGFYWAMDLWANHMGNRLVKSNVTGSKQITCFATMREGKPAILLINESASDSKMVNIPQGNDWKTAERVEFSYKNYLWNPNTHAPLWSRNPVSSNISDITRLSALNLPPLSATVIKINTSGTLTPPSNGVATPMILLPKQHTIDLPLTAMLVLRDGDNNTPFLGSEQTVELTINGPLTTTTTQIDMTGPAVPITFKSTGPGRASITLKCGNTSTTTSIELIKTKQTDHKLWTFANDAAVKQATPQIPARHNGEARRNQDVMELMFKDFIPVKGKDFACNFNLESPTSIPFKKDEVGGIFFDLKRSRELANAPEKAALLVIMQSNANHWMIIDSIPLNQIGTEWKQHRIELELDKLRAMPQLYSLIFQIKGFKPINGSLFIDDIGLIQRH